MTATTTTEKKHTARKGTARKPVPAPTQAADAGAPLEALVGDLPSGPRMVDLDRLVDHPRNPRTAMDPEDLQALADSIRAQGVRQNLLVVPDPGEEGRHMIVIGHRRAAAARMAGLEQVPAVVDPTLPEAQQLELMLVENMQRSDLTVVEEADGYQGLLDLGVSRAEMAKATGVSKAKVASRLKVAAQPAEVKAKLSARQATLEDVERLAAFTDEPETHAALLEALGTGSFSWKIAQEERNRQTRLDRAANLARLEELGVAVVEDYASLPDGLRYLGLWPSPRFTDEDLLAPGIYVIGRGYGSELNVHGPRSEAEEAETEARRAEREEQERRVAEQVAAVQTAADLRTAFLLERTTGAKSLTRPQTDVVLDFYVRLQFEFASHVRPSEKLFHGWTGTDVNSLDGRPAGQVFLALAAVRVEGVHDALAHIGYPYNKGIRTLHTAREEGWDKEPLVSTWYEVLQSLGYEPSPWERARLAGEPFPGVAEEPPAEATSS